MPNKAAGWVQDPKNPSRYTYTAEDGSIYESIAPSSDPAPAPEAETPEADPYGEAAVAEPAPAPVAAPVAAKASGWVEDPKQKGRYTYTDTDGSVYESVAQPQAQAQAPLVSHDEVPLIGGPQTAADKTAVVADNNENLFSKKARELGGFGISKETQDALGGQYSPLSTIANIGTMGLQGIQIGSEIAAEGLDDAFKKSGLAKALSVDGNDFLPGSAAMALFESAPEGGMEHGLPHGSVVGPTQSFLDEVRARIRGGASKADINDFAAANGQSLDQSALDTVMKDPTRPFDVQSPYRTRTQEAAVKKAVIQAGPDATPEVLAQALMDAGHDPAILDNQPFKTMKQRKLDAQQARVDDVSSRVNDITKDWTNAPEFETVHSVDDIADPEIRQAAIDSGAKGDSDYEGAKGFLGPDGKVRLLTENIKDPDELHAVVFHEALGHYGLAQKFGDALDSTLNDFYENSSGTFRQKVDDWMEKNPDYYKGQDNPQLLASEEVLAEMSERGTIPVELKDKVANAIKGYGRQVGLNLRYSDREIGTILGMSHDAVVNGFGRDVAANGFRLAKVYHGSPHDFDSFDTDKNVGTGDGGQLYGYGSYFTDDRKLAEAYRKGPGSKVYETEIPDDNYMEYNRPLAEQPHVLNALKEEGFQVLTEDERQAMREKVAEHYSNGNYKDAMALQSEMRDSQNASRRAGDVYHDLAFEHGDKEVSAALDRQGVPGATWDSGTGGKNYVVYNDNKASIVNKYMQRRRVTGDEPGNESGAMMSGNINLDRINTSNDVSSILDELQKRSPRVASKTFDAVKQEARDLNLDPKKVMRGTKGVGNVSAKLFAYRQVQTDVLDEVAELSKKLAENYDEAGHASYLKKMSQLAVVHARVSEDTAEVGRALNSLKMMTQSSRRANEILQALHESGLPMSSLANKDVFMRFMKQVQDMQDMNNPGGAAAMITKVVKPYWEDYILSGRHSMMLSGLGTHYKNFRDNLNIIAREYIESGLAVGWAGVAKEEMAARTYGLMRALLDANTYKSTVDAFVQGMENSKIGTKMELESARIPILSKVGDALNASDIFFRHFIETTNLYANGVRKAQSEGFKGKQLFAQGSHYALNPDDKMLELSRKQADVALLVSEPSGLAKGVEAMKTRQIEMSAGRRTARFIAHLMFPFLRTTENLVYQQLRRSPLSFMDATTRADFMAGGARRGTAITRTALGSAVMGYYIWKAKQGDVTGQEKDLKKQAALEPGGYKPNSVVSDKGYTDASALNLSFPNPFGIDNATAANVATLTNTYEGMKKTGANSTEAAGASVKAFLNIMANASFAQNVQPYVDAATEPTGSYAKAGNVVGGLAAQFTPALARQINNADIDTVKRDYTGDRGFKDRVVGKVEAGIPGLSDNFPLRRDVYGQEVKKGANITGVGAFSAKPTDPTIKEMQRVENTTDNPVITVAPRTLHVEGMEAKLTGQVYSDYQKAVGDHLVSTMREVVKTDGWKAMTDQDKREVMREAQKEARQAAKADILPKMSIDDFKDPKKDK